MAVIGSVAKLRQGCFKADGARVFGQARKSSNRGNAAISSGFDSMSCPLGRIALVLGRLFAPPVSGGWLDAILERKVGRAFLVDIWHGGTVSVNWGAEV